MKLSSRTGAGSDFVYNRLLFLVKGGNLKVFIYESDRLIIC